MGDVGHGAARGGLCLGLAGALGIVQGASFASIPQLNASDADRVGAAGAIAQLGNLGTTSGTPLLVLTCPLRRGQRLAAFDQLALGITIHAVQARRRITA